MLEQLLKQLQEGGTYRVSSLARQLDVSEALVMQMLADLARLGYLRPVEADCQAQCSGCAEKAVCTPLRSGRLWTTK